MGTRRKAREWALQALYLSDSSKLPREKAMAILQREFSDLGNVAGPFAEQLYFGTLDDMGDLDKKIQACTDNWEMSRMSCVDRSLLRLAAHELLGDYQTPVPVVIDEALEIAKKFSGPDSSRFLNGILDKVKTYKSAKKDGKKD